MRSALARVNSLMRCSTTVKNPDAGFGETTRANADALLSASSSMPRSDKKDRKCRAMNGSLRGAAAIGKGLIVDVLAFFRGFGG